MTYIKVLKTKAGIGEDFQETFNELKLRSTLERLSFGLDSNYVNLDSLIDLTIAGLPDVVTTDRLLDLLAENLASRVTIHHDHSILAGRILAHQSHKQMKLSFSANVKRLQYMDRGNRSLKYKIFSQKFYDTVMKHAEFFDGLINEKRDYDLTYFSWRTLQKSYFISYDDVNFETPQYLFLRTAVGIHFDDLPRVSETYDLMSQRYFIHASPTLFNAGKDLNYLSSCFLVGMESDSIDGIFKTLHKVALISKGAGGVGLHVSNIRSRGALISSSNGNSSGLVPMLKIFNETARYVDQGGNKRPGAFAIYIEPWHMDIFEVLNLRRNNGKEELRARDLFYALWIPDLFMKRVEKDGEWTLFSPDEAVGLNDSYGEHFESLYISYEKSNINKKCFPARKLWKNILESQIETGGPYMMYKDSCNEKSNQKNLGAIKSSNLCCEVIEYSSPQETAVCNLGSLALPLYITVDKENDNILTFDYMKLHENCKILAKNLDKTIDVTLYPDETSKYSNMKNRPIAIGVQGLADLFLELGLPFDSSEARSLNIQIFETIYHAAIEASVELAEQFGPYMSFQGSPISEGILQFDLWNHEPSQLFNDWEILKEKVKRGVRNSLLVAPMPTASTSQILGFNECFEPYTSNIYNRRVLSGEFQIINKYLLQDLIHLGLWSPSMKEDIIRDNGSIQNIDSIPQDLKDLYKTAWEIPQRLIIDLACDRAKFIDQSQSMNIFMNEPNFSKLTSCHFYGWKQGLKTGMYYLRTQAAARAIQFTVGPSTKRVQGHKNFKTIKRRKYKPIFSDDLSSRNEVLAKLEVDIPENDFAISKLERDTNNKHIKNDHVDVEPLEYNSDNNYGSCSVDSSEPCFSCSG